MNYKLVSALVAACLVSFCLGRFSGPRKIETREVEKVVYKEREVKDRNQDVTEHKKETKLPDGTIVTETVKSKKTETHTDRSSEDSRETISEKRIENRPDWRIGVTYAPPLRFQNDRYGVVLERRIFSELYLGVYGQSDKTIGASISFGF